MGDDPEGLARISNSIDQGNQVFKDFALNHGGSQISAGGDEGILSVPPTALNDLQDVKSKYEEAIQLTVSIGIGMVMSQAFKALLCAKLRGKNRTTFYDKECEEEIKAAQEDTESEAHKIVKEYLTKAQTVHHTGEGGNQSDFQVQESSANPDIQSQQELQDFHHQEPTNFEEEFRNIATDNEKKDQAKKASNSKDIEAIKQKVASSLQAVHKQLPILAQIKQASPETYSAVLGVVQGLIAIGRQLQDNDQQLAKAIGATRRTWVGGGSSIPALGTPERKTWENNYKQAVANYFTEGKPHLLKLMKFPIDKVDRSHSVFGNEAKTRLYHRMVRGGDKMPPGFGSVKNGRLKIVDGNRRLDVALANKQPHFEAYVPMGKGEVDVTRNPNLPPAGMHATSDGGLTTYDLGMDKADLMPGGLADALRPEDFDAEQLAIGTQIELSEHTDDIELAREIAMDQLTEDPDYYKKYTESNEDKVKQEPMVKDGLKEDKEELDPSKPVNENSKILDKGVIPEHIKSIRAHHKLVPGQIVDSRHIVVKTPAGKNAVREVSAGMQRDLSDSVSNPIGPGAGSVTSARNKPSRD